MWLEGAHPLEINETLCKERERERNYVTFPLPPCTTLHPYTLHTYTLHTVHLAYSTPCIHTHCIQYTENIQTSCEDGAPTRGI